MRFKFMQLDIQKERKKGKTVIEMIKLKRLQDILNNNIARFVDAPLYPGLLKEREKKKK